MVNEAIKHLVYEKLSSAGIDLSNNNRDGLQIKDPRFYEKLFITGFFRIG